MKTVDYVIANEDTDVLRAAQWILYDYATELEEDGRERRADRVADLADKLGKILDKCGDTGYRFE